MELRIERAVYGGSGIGRTEEGETVFVPFTLPGELVEIQLTGSRQPLQAELINVIQPASSRITAKCEHFGACGGCQYQHAAYDAQQTIKRDILSETMERSGLRDLPAIAMHSAGPWHYRNRIRLRIKALGSTLHLGYSKRGSNEFLPITMCPIAAPVLWSTAASILALANTDAAVHAWLAATEEIELFAAADSDIESHTQLSLFLNESGKAKRGGINFASLCEKINATAPIHGAGTFTRKGPRTIAESKWGADGLFYEAAGQKYWITRGSFFQINRLLIDKLADLVTSNRVGTLAWDLYAGVGLFSRRLAENFSSITAIEAAEPAVTDLRAMLTKLGPQHRAIKATTLDFLRGAVLQRDLPDLIVMDPPRAGLGVGVTALLARIAAPQLVYVSCDPATLSRDLRALIDSGYHIEVLHLFDLFPQTFHLETVVMLRR